MSEGDIELKKTENGIAGPSPSEIEKFDRFFCGMLISDFEDRNIIYALHRANLNEEKLTIMEFGSIEERTILLEMWRTRLQEYARVRVSKENHKEGESYKLFIKLKPNTGLTDFLDRINKQTALNNLKIDLNWNFFLFLKYWNIIYVINRNN